MGRGRGTYGQFGNPFTTGEALALGLAQDVGEARVVCVEAFQRWLVTGETAWPIHDASARRVVLLKALPTLADHDLMCWCPENTACHADVLLELTDQSAQIAVPGTEPKSR